MNKTLSWLTRAAALMGLVLCMAHARAEARFEAVNGTLMDHATGVAWQSLAATAGTPLPVSPQFNNARVATLNELFNVLPITAGEVQLVSRNSDLYTALSFFAATAPQSAGACLGNATQGASCFQGWAQDMSLPGTYNMAGFWFAPVPGQIDQISYFSVASLGPYSPSFCFAQCDVGQFTVTTVPEPSQLKLLLAGFVLAFIFRLWQPSA